MIRALFFCVMLLAIASPASAHKLKVFAAVEGRTVGGYAFFIGGGRPQSVPWVAKDAQGATIAEGTTDEQGRFAFALPGTVASDITVTVDTREAHIASATLSAARLGIGVGAAVASGATVSVAGAEAQSRPLADTQIAALVDAAVQRQVEPLLERIEEMDSRLRFVDVLSGVFFIAGLAGMALWARGRRR